MGKWLLGILLIVIGAAAYALIMGPKISENMGDDIRAALQNQNHDWAGVEMNGHIATVTGNAPSNDAARGAVEIAQDTVCSDCQTDTPWHRVLSDVNVTTAQQAQIVEMPVATTPVQSLIHLALLSCRMGASLWMGTLMMCMSARRF